jgi:hypothetical protein
LNSSRKGRQPNNEVREISDQAISIKQKTRTLKKVKKVKKTGAT